MTAAPLQRQRAMPLILATVFGALAVGLFAWPLHLRSLERQISQTRSELKKLSLSGGITPSRDVMEYLAMRQERLQRRYDAWIKVATVPPVDTTTIPNLQVYFQEQLHDVQQQLERLALERQVPVPEQLGFPKELPPMDAVPRLLVQLALVREMVPLMLERGLTQVTSVKLEDPEPVPSPDEEQEGFMMRLPIRVRVSGSLASVLDALGVVERLTPLVDLRTLRLVSQSTDPGVLDVEFGLARYLLLNPTISPQPTAHSPQPDSARHTAVS